MTREASHTHTHTPPSVHEDKRHHRPARGPPKSHTATPLDLLTRGHLSSTPIVGLTHRSCHARVAGVVKILFRLPTWRARRTPCETWLEGGCRNRLNVLATAKTANSNIFIAAPETAKTFLATAQPTKTDQQATGKNGTSAQLPPPGRPFIRHAVAPPRHLALSGWQQNSSSSLTHALPTPKACLRPPSSSPY